MEAIAARWSASSFTHVHQQRVGGWAGTRVLFWGVGDEGGGGGGTGDGGGCRGGGVSEQQVVDVLASICSGFLLVFPKAATKRLGGRRIVCRKGKEVEDVAGSLVS